MKIKRVYTLLNLCLINKLGINSKASLITCFAILFTSVKTQNLIPNYSFENVILNENNTYNIPGFTTDWQTIKSSDWFHTNNVGTQNLWTCPDSICAGVPKNIAGYQYPKSGLGYAGIGIFDKYNSNGTKEFLKVKLNDTINSSKQYCVSFNLALAQLGRYAISKVGAYFTTNEYIPPPFPAGHYWHFHVSPQALNNGPFITDTLNWTKVEMSFVADSAYQWITIGSFTDSLTTDSIRVSNVPGGYQGAYYYIDDIFLTELDEPASAAITDTLVATENTAIQLGNNTNTNASYLWWPADNVSDVNNLNPNLLVTQSGWHYVQKTQCSYVTYDSVYVKANPVGLKKYNYENELFTLQPNPNNGEFVLLNKLNKMTSGTLFIYDSQGALVEEIPLKKQNTIRVKLNNCKGIYFLRLVDENNATVYLGKTLVE